VSPNIQLAIGLLIGLGLIPVLAFLFTRASVEVDDGEAVLVTRFGKLVATLKTPGYHFSPSGSSPGSACTTCPCGGISVTSRTCTSTTPAAPR
jgi:hypothetical protein